MFASRADYRWMLSSHGTTRPANTYGVSVTPVQNAYGSYVGLGALNTALPYDAHGIYIGFYGGYFDNATDADSLLKVGWDTSGGTSYQDKIAHLVSGATGAPFGGFGNIPATYHFPIFIPAGSRIAVCASTRKATVGTLSAFGMVYGRPGNPHLSRPGRYVRTFGADAANSRGTIITEGTTSDGTWTQLGANVAAGDSLWHWQLGMACGKDGGGSVAHACDLSAGDGTTQQKLIEDEMTSTSFALHFYNTGVRYERFCRVAPGRGIYGRVQSSGAAAPGTSVIAYATGG